MRNTFMITGDRLKVDIENDEVFVKCICRAFSLPNSLHNLLVDHIY